MNRVLVTGGAGPFGAAIVRRLLRDPDFEVRVSDQRPLPQWIREGCEVHLGDLRDITQARDATAGCSHVVDLSAYVVPGAPDEHAHTAMEVAHARQAAALRAALDHDVERFTYVSSAGVLERAVPRPAAEDVLGDAPAPRSPRAFSALAGELLCRAAREEHGLAFTICRPSEGYGLDIADDAEPGISPLFSDLVRQVIDRRSPLSIPRADDVRLALTRVDDVADGVVTAMAAPAALNDDFNITAEEALTVRELATLIWTAFGNDPGELDLAPSRESPAAPWLSGAKAAQRLGWRARTPLREGVSALARRVHERELALPAQPSVRAKR